MQPVALVTLICASLCAAQSSIDTAAVYSSFQAALESGASGLASEYSSLLATNSLPPMTSATNVGGGAPGQTNNRAGGAAMPAATPFVGAAGMVAGVAGIAAMMI